MQLLSNLLRPNHFMLPHAFAMVLLWIWTYHFRALCFTSNEDSKMRPTSKHRSISAGLHRWAGPAGSPPVAQTLWAGGRGLGTASWSGRAAPNLGSHVGIILKAKNVAVSFFLGFWFLFQFVLSFICRSFIFCLFSRMNLHNLNGGRSSVGCQGWDLRSFHKKLELVA